MAKEELVETDVETPKTARINFHVDDKIAFGKEFAYSSVTYGLSVTRDVPDNGLEEIFQKHVPELVEEVEGFVAEERARILEIIQGEASSAKKR